MSTRCNIIIKERYFNNIYLYHHTDGNPGGVGSVLYELCKKCNEKGCCINGPMLANRLVKKGVVLVDRDGKVVDTDDRYEITSCIHGDIDYLYEIRIVENVSGHTHLSVTAYDARDENHKVNISKKRVVAIPYSDDDPLHVQI